MLIFAFLVVWQLFTQRQPETKLGFSTFIQKVEKAPEEIKPNTLQIRTSAAGNHAQFKGQWKKDDQVFVTEGYIGDSIFEKLNKSGLQYEIVKENEGGFWQQVLITWLPMIVLVVLFLVFMRQLQVGGGKAMSFGKSKAKLLSENQKKITFTDVAGIEEAKDEVE